MSAANVGDGGGVINVEALLAPIAGESPAGVSLRYEETYREIASARLADDQLEQGDWKRERKLSDWPRVVELASEALASRSKDLQIGAWLAEALVNLHGFAGLSDGMKLMRGLQLNFWDDLFPSSDGGDLNARANTLTWFDRQMSIAVRAVPVTRGDGDTRYTFNDAEDSKRFNIPENFDATDSVEVDRANKIRMKAADERKINSEQWRAAKETTPRSFYETTFGALNDCWAEFQALDAATDSKFGAQSPGFPLLKDTLDALLKLVEPIVIRKRELEPDKVAAAPAAVQESPAPGGAQAAGALVVSNRPPQGLAPAPSAAPSDATSREEAYRKLLEAAAYFRQAEPHSPVSYLVERAVRWGQMPLEEWLAEVVKSDDVLLSLRETLGLTQRSDGGQAYEDDGGG